MIYTSGWIEKHMGILRSTQRLYEKKGFLKPERNDENKKYKEYSEEDLIRLWSVKSLVKLGFSLEEIEHMIYDPDPDFDFRATMEKKIDNLEEQKRELEQLIGHAKQIKETGIIPTIPKEMGSIKFDDFFDYSCQNWNIETDPETKIAHRILEYINSKPDIEWNEEEIIQLLVRAITNSDSGIVEIDIEKVNALSALIKEIFSNLGAMLVRHSYYKELAALSDCDVSHPTVQKLVKKIYAFDICSVFRECIDKITPQWYADHVTAFFSGSDFANLNERVYGKESCEFIAEAIEYFGENFTCDDGIKE